MGALLRVLDRLCDELDYEVSDDGDAQDDSQVVATSPESVLGNLTAEDEATIAALRRELARMTAALASDGRRGRQDGAVAAALDGTELVMRSELMRGDLGQIRRLMPDIVFLVALAIVDRDQALTLSRRAAELIRDTPGA